MLAATFPWLDRPTTVRFRLPDGGPNIQKTAQEAEQAMSIAEILNFTTCFGLVVFVFCGL
jgi:hypothetical protein